MLDVQLQARGSGAGSHRSEGHWATGWWVIQQLQWGVLYIYICTPHWGYMWIWLTDILYNILYISSMTLKPWSENSGCLSMEALRMIYNDENESGTKWWTWWKWWKWLCKMSYLFCGFGFEFCRGMFSGINRSPPVLQTSLAVKHRGSMVSTGDDARIPNHHDGQKFPKDRPRADHQDMILIHGSNLSHPKI